MLDATNLVEHVLTEVDQGWQFVTLSVFLCLEEENKLAKLQATLLRNYDSLAHWGEV